MGGLLKKRSKAGKETRGERRKGREREAIRGTTVKKSGKGNQGNKREKKYQATANHY